jgi:transposase-like protein
MREFVFNLVYENLPSPLDHLSDDPAAVSSTGIGGCIDTDEFWRFERFSGPEEKIGQCDNLDSEQLLAAEQITAESCLGECHVELLEQTSTECELYYHFKSVSGCESIPTLAVEYIGTDVLFEIERTDARETWTVMMEDEEGVGLFYDAVQVSLQQGIRFEFGHIGQATGRRTALFARENLPTEQREAIVAAVRRGYYERPREITLDELSDELGCPRSTLSYRLRSAESKLAKAFAVDEGTTELQSFPLTPQEGSP